MLTKRFQYKQWADARTLEAIEQMEGERFQAKYAFTLQQVNHMVIVDELFRSRLEQKPAPHPATNSEVVPGYDELDRRLRSSAQWYLDYVGQLPPEDLEKVISFTFADGKAGSLSVEEMLFHVVNHGSYHRGSIAHALDLADVAHPADGYGIFIHEMEPGRRGSTA